MKITCITLIALVCSLFSLTGWAQDKENDDVTSYEFDDALVEGDLLTPDHSTVTGRRNEHSRSLVKVRSHFVPEMLKSVERI